MTQTVSPQSQVPAAAATEFAEGVEQGRRRPTGFSHYALCLTALAWSLFQLWYASPLPFIFDVGVFNDAEARSIHLAFALFLAFLAFPAHTASPLQRVPAVDWALALTGAMAALYLVVFRDDLAGRAGAPLLVDLVIGGIGLVLLLEATRRAVGPPLLVVAAVFLLFSLTGPWMPEALAHKGVSLSRLLSHQWLGTEGVFGVAIGVSAGFVFLFVLFGALLEQAGAGSYFIRLAYSVLGHLRGGPAKAAVAASGLSGMVSGSSIANVVTTGTFTIPLMKRVGLPAEKAGAIEVAASTNGQLMPPIMGAAAFLMVEYVGISYIEVIKHALLPALISYIALFYIVHLEAVKSGFGGLQQVRHRTLTTWLIGALTGFLTLALLGALLYYGLGWVKVVAGDASALVFVALFASAYLGCLRLAAGVPDDGEALSAGVIPPFVATLRSGLHFLLPIVVLVWNLVVERLSPGLAVFWAILALAVVVVTQRPLKAWYRGSQTVAQWSAGWRDLHAGLVHGARNMVGIAVATATAGIVVGTVTLTGIGLMLTDLVEFLSGGNLLLILIFTAVISLLLGMGLPTTANYIVVSSLMVPVIQTLGAQQGLVVPLIALHLFVFYFGILADDTPPVGLAAFAASAISGGEPLKTGVQGFMYDIRTAILPFMFIFNTELLLIGIVSWWHLVVTVIAAITAMLLFAAATQGYWLVRSRWWESLLLLLVAFSLLRPGFWWDRVFPPEQILEPQRAVELAGSPGDSGITLIARGETLEGDTVELRAKIPLAGEGEGETRLADAGLVLRQADQGVFVDMVTFGSPAQEAGLDLDWEVLGVAVEAERPPKQWLYPLLIPLLALVAWGQRRRAQSRDRV